MKLIRQKTAAVFQRLSVESEAINQPESREVMSPKKELQFKSFFLVTTNSCGCHLFFVTNPGWNLNFFQFAFAYLPRPCGQKRQESKPKQRLPKTVKRWVKKDVVGSTHHPGFQSQRHALCTYGAGGFLKILESGKATILILKETGESSSRKFVPSWLDH